MIIKEQTLAPNEKFRFEQCEKAIERGLNTFVEVGRALSEIRDSKLYRIGFKTFEAYCKERWDIGRSRAYQLIDHAKVSEAIATVTENLSTNVDISEGDARVLKAELSTAAAEIKTRIDNGEQPSEAIAATVSTVRENKDKAKSQQDAIQSSNDAASQAIRDRLPQSIKDAETAKAERRAEKSAGASADDTAELREIIAHQDQTVISLEAELEKFSAMKSLFIRGGFEAVVAAKDEEIRTLQTRVSAESRDKASWMRKAGYWKDQAEKLGWQPARGEQTAPLSDDDAFYDVIEGRA